MGKLLPLLISGDIFSAILTHYLGLRFHYSLSQLIQDDSSFNVFQIGVFVVVLVLLAYLVELYDSRQFKDRKSVPVRILITLILAFIVLSFIYSAIPQFVLDKSVIIAVLIMFGFLQLLWHLYSPSLLKMPGVAQRVLILGVGPMAHKIEQSMENNKNNYVLAGYVQPTGEAVAVSPLQILAPLEGFLDVAIRENVKKIVISLTEKRGVLPLRDLLQARFRGIEIVDAASFHEELAGALLVENINPGWFIYSGGFCFGTCRRKIKRFYDIILSLIGSLLVVPFVPLIALVVKLDSPGSVLHSQIRLGSEEKEFRLYKFRTMRADAESKTGAVWAQKNDPRITRIGKILRKTRLDEIPQLYNVFRGDMSLVGPRPERPEFVEKLKDIIPYYSRRHSLKPGVTGWAQVKYPYGGSIADAQEKLKYDLYYIKHYSLLLDFLILLETVKVVLFGRGGR